jgi:chloramphenicol-sensitive protein RarD
MISRPMLLAILSYVFWGFFPIYWKFLKHIPSLEILSHRMIWSFVFYYFIFKISFPGKSLRTLLAIPRRQWWLSGLAALLLAVNWGTYIYAVNSGKILQGSLAYFINPLLNVAVGVLFFKEAITTPLKIAFTLASVGVLLKATMSPDFPYISILLATTFCLYGVVKKKLSISPNESSVLEGIFGVLPGILVALLFMFSPDRGHSHTPTDWLLFIGSGVVTGLPLYWFSIGAQKIPYSLMGMFQFIAPSLQFMVGVWMYGEPMTTADWLAFGFIWGGAAFYIVDRLRPWLATRRLPARPNLR